MNFAARARRWCAWVALMLMAGTLAAVRPQMAWAANDTVDSWTINYSVDEQGVLNVDETLTYRFGTTTGRHGIIRSLVSREPYDDKQDMVFDISNVQVTSPDASSTVRRRTVGDGRNQTVELVIGSSNDTITSQTATYRIRYTVRGAMRTNNGNEQLYWDALSGETPLVRKVRVEISLPDGVQQAQCWSAPVQGTTPCTGIDVRGGKAILTQEPKRAGDILTVAALAKPGAIAVVDPILAERADAGSQRVLYAAVGVTGASAVGSSLIGWAYWRRKGRDLRFAGMPPGTLPPAGTNAPFELSDPRMEVPVAFSPPDVPVAEAGLLADGQVDVRETTATLVDLAVRGVIQLRMDSDEMVVRLANPNIAMAPHEAVLINRVFSTSDEVELGRAGKLTRAHDALVTSVRNQVAERRWFTDVPHVARRASIGSAAFAVLVLFHFFAARSLGGTLPWLIPVVPILIVWLVVRRKLRRGQRTPVGRAITDQIEGFRKYLATAEADQLRFEEGEDIFSKYLPWAIIFELTDRWARICQQLVDAGRIPAMAPAWYYGDPYLFNYWAFTRGFDSVESSVMPAPSSSGSMSGTGFGGGGAFSGGGFSGGGGGGGGVSSW